MRVLTRWVSMLTVVGLLAGCGDDTGTGSGGSATVPDHSGANTAITSSNAQVVLTETSSALYGALGRVLAAAAAGKQAVPVATKSVTNKIVNGTVSGKVTIKSGTYDVTTSGQTSNQTLQADVVFEDFSDNGQIWIGGPMNIEVISSINPSNPTALTFSFKQKGDLAFSGKYKGSLGMDLSVSISNGLPSVSGSVTVDGNKINLN